MRYSILFMLISALSVKAGDDTVLIDQLRNAKLDKVLQDKDLHTVSRGTVAATIVLPGMICAEDEGAIRCELKAKSPATSTAATIRWVAEEGTRVKKGDKLIQFDDSWLQDQLDDQEIRTLQAKGRWVAAKVEVDELPLKIELAENDLKIAKLELEKHAKDDLDKQILKLKVQRAELLFAIAKSEGRRQHSAAVLETEDMVFKKELSRVADLKDEIKRCVIVAHRDGVVFHLPRRRAVKGISPMNPPLVEQGEPVHEGQKLLLLPNLSSLLLRVRVDGTNVAHAPVDQKASIRVDGDADRVFRGYLLRWSPQPVLDTDEFEGLIKIDDNLSGLKLLHKTGKASIAVELGDVLRVPLSSVLAGNKGAYCCILEKNNEVRLSPIQIGVRGVEFVEVRSGLKQGEQVIVDPRTLLKRLP